MADETPAGFADQIGLILAISAGGAIFTVLALRFKAWLYGEPEIEPPVLPHLMAYLLAYLACFAAAFAFPRPWSLLVMAGAAAPAFAVTVRGRQPLLTPAYLRTTAVTFGVFVAIWAIYLVLLQVGIDLAG